MPETREELCMKIFAATGDAIDVVVKLGARGELSREKVKEMSEMIHKLRVAIIDACFR